MSGVLTMTISPIIILFGVIFAIFNIFKGNTTDVLTAR